jgi:hypothetical protein
MPRLNLVENTPDKLSFKMGALAFIGQVSFASFIAVVVAAALTLFVRRWIGNFLAFTFIACPGIACGICGVFGCFNARSFYFTFDRQRGEFSAVAGSARISVALSHIVLVYLERECDASGGSFGTNSPPSFSVTLLLSDGHRFHLEGGVPVTGSDRGPPELHSHCELIREFLYLPSQSQVPLLELTKASKPEPVNDAQARERLSRWLSCAGIAPKWESPLYEYNWLDAPQGVQLPRPASRPFGQGVTHVMQAPIQTQMTGDRWGNRVAGVPVGNPRSNPGSGQIVMGRVAGTVQPQQPRQVEVVVPAGMQGQLMQVRTPDGAQLQVTVPDDAVSGQAITLQY